MRNTKRTMHYVISTNQRSEASFPVQVGMAIGVISLCALVLVFGAGKSIANTNVSLPIGPGSLNHAKGWCGQRGQPACRSNLGWLSATSEQPGEIAHMMMSSPEYAMLRKRAGYATLDVPTRVYSLHMNTGIAYYDMDHWVASARSTTGIRVGLFDFVYDAAYKRLRFASFGVIMPDNVHAHMAFPYVVRAQIMAKLQSQPGIHLLAESRPELVFFQIDPRYRDLSSNKYRWYDGGDSPMNPLWHVAGVAGKDYFVGSNLRTYTSSMIMPLMVR